MQQSLLTVSQPELWKLALMPGPKSLDVALYPPLARDEMVWQSFPYAEPTLQAIEEIVYANPELLADYKSVCCIIDYTPYVTIPDDVTAEEAAIIYDASVEGIGCVSGEPAEVYTCGAGAAIALRQPRAVADFIRRTFFNISMRSAAADHIAYFVSRTDPGAVVYAPYENGRVKITALNAGRPLLANEFEAPTIADAAYYIMWAVQELGLGLSETSVYTGGVGLRHSELPRLIGRYIPGTAPMPIPQLRYRGSKSTFEAPLELLIHPLCE